VFTHAHPTNIWGTLTEDGDLASQCQYYVGTAEWDFLDGPNYTGNMPPCCTNLAMRRTGRRDP